MAERFDAIVIGGGAVGTAAARSLAARDRSVVLFERFTFGHGFGSSGGPTRIFRYNYAEPDYVEMVRRAEPLWRELEGAAGVELLRKIGGIDAGPEAREPAAAVAAAGIAIRRADAREVAERWPALRFPDDAELYLQEDAGVLRAEATVRAQVELAGTLGADLRDGVRVTALRTTGDEVEIETEHGETSRARVAIVAAGSWAPELLAGAGIDVRLAPSLETVTYCELDDPSPLPTVIDRWDDGYRADYAVPDPWSPGAFKFGLHQGGVEGDLEPAWRPDPDPAVLERTRVLAAERFAPHREVGADACLYTNTPDTDFVLDRRGPVVVASPCSGHGFKFVPLVGRIVADLATGATPEVPLDRFTLGRPALRR